MTASDDFSKILVRVFGVKDGYAYALFDRGSALSYRFISAGFGEWGRKIGPRRRRRNPRKARRRWIPHPLS